MRLNPDDRTGAEAMMTAERLIVIPTPTGTIEQMQRVRDDRRHDDKDEHFDERSRHANGEGWSR